ncbi:MAG: 2-methylcitrate dehydratase [Betaproteobacteria bacterium]|nr:2-methylcitrate dehydratase [Betaproteobacteria bacterium]
MKPELAPQETFSTDAPSFSRTIAGFVAGIDHAALPQRLRDFARFHMLDVIGTALAATKFEFAQCALRGLSAMADGGCGTVIGMNAKLPLKDAVIMNGILAHGLDYDDTHPGGPVHPSSSAFPCALGLAEFLDRDGRQMLTAYLLSVEIATRFGIATNRALLKMGYHTTGVAGHMGCALGAGHLLRLNADQLVYAQGLAGSTASALAEHRADGAWNKRFHPGWAGAGAITAASLASSGFIGTQKIYEGHDGLFRSHAGEHLASVMPDELTNGLGEVWRAEEVGIKPFPVCHFLHACIDSVLILKQKYELRPDDIAQVRALLHPDTFHSVCDFAELRRAPASDYIAKFSVYYTLAAALVRGRCGFAELEDSALKDPHILALAERVVYDGDPDSMFPKYFSGGAVITLKDGRTFTHVEKVNRGAGDRALSGDDIEAKFIENAELVTSPARARQIRDLALDIERHSARELAAALARV